MLRHLPLLTALLCVVTGCAISNSPQQASVGLDATIGRYGDGLESNLVLITMTPQKHAELTEISGVLRQGQLPHKYQHFIDALGDRYGLTRVADWPLPAIDIYCIIFEIDGQQSRQAVVAALATEQGIESAQPVQTFGAQSGAYNDPYLSMQHGFHTIQVSQTHRWTRGAGVTVALIDTGLDNQHPDLVASTATTRNFVDKNETAFRADIHGTALGGIIAASADNGTGMVGIAPESRLLALKACWQSSTQDDQAQCNSLTLAKALNFSILNNADVINLSLTGPPDPLLERLVAAALHRNMIVVGARPDHSNPAFPISIPGTIAVGISTDIAAGIAAPGTSVLSTKPDNQYDFFNGSSFSTAHIAGLAALMRSARPELTPPELHALLVSTADPDTGMANACRALQTLKTEQTQNGDSIHCS